jgi:hypothetical protein
MSDPNLLPRRDELHVEEKKVVNYLLNPDSADGKSKARFFTRLGFTRQAWTVFADALREHGATRPISQTKTTPFGQMFVLECEIITPDERNPCIETVWIVEEERPPRLVTAYPR